MSTIRIRAASGTAEAYVARPGSGSGPGVLLFIDIFGVRPQIEAMCDRIASWGYVVMAPNVFYRLGSIADLAPTVDMRQPGGREESFKRAMRRPSSISTEQTLADIDAYVRALRGLDGVADGPIGVTGYCAGARWATMAATHHPADIAVLGGFHGGKVVTDAPDSPHLGLDLIDADVVYLHADNDSSMSPEAIDTLEELLEAAQVAHVNEVYPGAPHGYSMADTSSYDEPAAERHYELLRAALGRRLPA